MGERTGLDTNVVLRWLFVDRTAPDQNAAATRAVEAAIAAGGVRLTVVVLAELVWLMRSRLGMDRSAQMMALQALIERDGVQIEDRPLVVAAIEATLGGPAGFADHLIGISNARAGCRTTLTFDKAAARAEGFRRA